MKSLNHCSETEFLLMEYFCCVWAFKMIIFVILDVNASSEASINLVPRGLLHELASSEKKLPWEKG